MTFKLNIDTDYIFLSCIFLCIHILLLPSSISYLPACVILCVYIFRQRKEREAFLDKLSYELCAEISEEVITQCTREMADVEIKLVYNIMLILY